MAEKFIPGTPSIKRGYARNSLGGLITQDEALMLFNRWYTRELEEAREEGRQEARATAASVPAHFIVFTGPHERYSDSGEAVKRTEALVAAGTESSVVRVDAISPVYATRKAFVTLDRASVIQ